MRRAGPLARQGFDIRFDSIKPPASTDVCTVVPKNQGHLVRQYEEAAEAALTFIPLPLGLCHSASYVRQAVPRPSGEHLVSRAGAVRNCAVAGWSRH